MSEYASKQSESHVAPAVASGSGATVGKHTQVEVRYGAEPALHAGSAAATTGGAPPSPPLGDRVQLMFGRPAIQRRATGAVTADPDAVVAQTADSTGTPLPADLGARFGASLGSDLSSVRVHTGAASASAAEGLGARAFAVGQDIHFAAGQYRPDDPSGVHLLAHETAHTVQQAGGAATRQYKLEVSTPGEAAEVEADRAADAMVTGAPATIRGTAPQIAREPAAGAAPDAATAGKPGAAPVWVEFDTKGNWNAAQVLANLTRQAAVPDDLRAAIQVDPKATASYFVALRDRVGTSEHDEAKQKQISTALSSRINELVHATPQSPLQYSQLAEAARWAAEYKATGAGTPATPAAPTTPAAPAAAGKGDAAATAYATQLAAQAKAPPKKGEQDEIRTAAFQANDEHKGEESGNAELAGWSFLRDPFDNTVTATRAASTATDDNAGLQLTFQVEKTQDGTAGKTTLIRTLVLSKLRLAALKRQDKMAPIEMQETEAEKNTRLANDKAMTAQDRKYDADHAKWVTDGKTGPEPVKPKGYLTVEHHNTLCVRTPGTVYDAAGGTKRGGFNFSGPLQKAAMPWAWRTLASNPDGPKPGDVYYLSYVATGQGAHMGVFKSMTPVSGSEDLYTWIVTDGGQGTYETINQAQERTRGPFNKKTGLFSSSIAEAGQGKGDRRLDGWVDIDAYNKGKPDPAESTVST